MYGLGLKNSGARCSHGLFAQLDFIAGPLVEITDVGDYGLKVISVVAFL